MLANLARISDDMQKVKGIVGGAMGSVESAAASATKALGAIGVALSAGAFVAMVKGTIDAMDRLHDLSKTTNITAETLAGLRVAAKQSGGDLDSIAASINKLSVEMGKSPEKFRELGVSAKDPLEAFKQLSDVFVGLHDPQQRAAVMAAALGKAWAGAAPLLAEGGQRIGEMVAKGTELSGVTTEMTRQADELNDKWVLLGGTGGFLTRMIGPLLPLLNTMADHMLKVQERSKGINEGFSPLLEVMKVLIVVGANVSFIFETMGKDIARMFENIRLIAKGDFAGSRALGELFRKDAAAAREALDAYTRTIMRMGTAGPGAPAAPGADPARAAAAAARARAFLGGGDDKAAKEAAAREQQVRDAMHKVREADDQRELAQIALLNEQRAAQEQARLQATFEMIDAEQAAAIAHGEQLIQIDEWVAENRKRIQRGFMDFLGNIAGLMNTQSRKVFEIGKLGALAQAAVTGALAVMEAWRAGMQTKGPWAPAVATAYATAAAANALNLINNIRKQTFGGGGGAPTPVAQGSSGVAGGGVGSSQAREERATQVIVHVNVITHGNIIGQDGIQQLVDENVIPALRDAIDNRDVTIIGANSRQAADLAAA